MRGYILIALAAMLWGTTGTAQALAPAGFTPLTIGALRILVGGLVLLAFALMRGRLRQGKRWPIGAVLLAGVAIAVYQLAFFEGTKRTGVAVGTMVAIGSAPVFAGLVDVIWIRNRLSWTWLAATTLAVLGIIVLLGTESDLQVNLTGIAIALTAGLSYVLYAIAVRRLTQTHSPEAVVAVVFCLGALLLLPLLLTADLTPVATPGGITVVLYLGLVATGLSYVLFSHGIRIVPVSSATTLSLMEPLVAATLGILVLGEFFDLQRAAGMLLILGGLIVLALRPSDRQKSEDRPT